MPIAHNGRTLPLAQSSVNPLGASLRLAWDFTGFDTSRLQFEAYDYVGATNPRAVVSGGSVEQVICNGIPGLQPVAIGAVASYTSAADFGFQVGTGDYTLCALISTPSVLPASSGSPGVLFRIDNGGSGAVHEFSIAHSTLGWSNIQVTSNVGTTSPRPVVGVNRTVALFVRRVSGVTSGWMMVLGVDSAVQRRHADFSSSLDLNSTNIQRIRFFNGTQSGNKADWAVPHSVRFHNAAFTEAEMTAYASDWWAVDEYPPPDITAPTITGTLTVSSVTTTGATLSWPAGADNVAVTSYERQIDGGAWVDVGLVLTVGLTGLAPSTAYTVRVRSKDAAGNVAATPIEATFTTLDVQPGDPSAVTAAVTGGTTATISWTAGSPAASTHTVQVESPSGAGNWTAATGVLAGVSFAATGLTPATGYRARVRGVNGALTTAWVLSGDFTTDNVGTGGGSLAAPIAVSVAGTVTHSITADVDVVSDTPGPDNFDVTVAGSVTHQVTAVVQVAVAEVTVLEVRRRPGRRVVWGEAQRVRTHASLALGGIGVQRISEEFDPLDPVEVDDLEFDFTSAVLAGETLDEALAVVSVLSGADAGAAALIRGAPVIFGNSVLVPVQGRPAGVVYSVRVDGVMTSGRRLPLAGIVRTVTV